MGSKARFFPGWCVECHNPEMFAVSFWKPNSSLENPIIEPENGFMEPKYLAFRRWLYTPCSSSEKITGFLGPIAQKIHSWPDPELVWQKKTVSRLKQSDTNSAQQKNIRDLDQAFGGEYPLEV